MADEPIIEREYLAGLKVVDIGDLRVSRGQTRRPYSACQHTALVYDPGERRIWCKDCEKDVDPFDAFKGLAERYSTAVDGLKRRQEHLDEVEQFKMRSIAAREMDKAWRSKGMVPCCPHCNNGLFPEDFKSGPHLISRDYAAARLARSKGK